MAKGKGRQKIEIQRIENDINRQVTFSKRRGGVFKKSSEISTLCGAEAAVIIFSPSSKAHSFGSPSVISVSNRFQRQTALGISEPNRSPSAYNNPIVRQRNEDLTSLGRLLEAEKQQKKELNRLKRAHQPNLDDLSLDQLVDLKEFITGFKKAFETKLMKEDGAKEMPAAAAEEEEDPNLDSDPFKNINETLFEGGPSGSLFDMGSFGIADALFLGSPILDPAAAGGGDNFEFPCPPDDPSNEDGSSKLTFPYKYGCPPDFVPDDVDVANDGGKD